jgi:hypothetical protein
MNPFFTHSLDQGVFGSGDALLDNRAQVRHKPPVRPVNTSDATFSLRSRGCAFRAARNFTAAQRLSSPWRCSEPAELWSFRRFLASMKFVRHILLIVAAMLLSGCGLFAVPQRQVALPPAHFRQVIVRDATTRKPLTRATVRYAAHKYSNWARLPVELRARPASESQPLGSVAFTLNAEQPSPGLYTFDQVSRSEWAQVFFPLGLPLGGVLQRYYQSSLTVHAPGHTAIRVWGSPPLEPTKALNPRYKASLPVLELSDRLTILLPRTQQ